MIFVSMITHSVVYVDTHGIVSGWHMIFYPWYTFRIISMATHGHDIASVITHGVVSMSNLCTDIINESELDLI